jgi:hypothetical protein
VPEESGQWLWDNFVFIIEPQYAVLAIYAVWELRWAVKRSGLRWVKKMLLICLIGSIG